VAGVVHVPFYATVFRKESMAAAIATAAPIALRYGATQYQVHHSQEDRYKVLMMIWFENKRDWYRFWEGPEMNEFRRRYASRFQIPLVYAWHDEIAQGALGPQVAPEAAPAPEPEPEPHASAT
jgi:hypothetical protein